MMGSHKKKIKKPSDSSCSDNETRSKKKSDLKKKKRRRESSSDSSSSSSSTDSSVERRRKLKKEKKKLKRLKKEKSRQKETLKVDKKKKKKDDLCGTSSDIPLHLMEKSKAMAPMTKDEWDKRQSVVRKVYDETTGRHRLIKGDGEVIEEIVSRDRHKEINQQATRGDGNFFQSKMSSGYMK